MTIKMGTLVDPFIIASNFVGETPGLLLPKETPKENYVPSPIRAVTIL
jgi:hypothetical protein